MSIVGLRPEVMHSAGSPARVIALLAAFFLPLSLAPRDLPAAPVIVFEIVQEGAFDPSADCASGGECLTILAARWLAVNGIRDNRVETYSQPTDVEATPDLPSGHALPVVFAFGTRLESQVTLDYANDTWHWETNLPFGGSTTGGSGGGGESLLFDVLVIGAGLVDGAGFQLPSITGSALEGASTVSLTRLSGAGETTLSGRVRDLRSVAVGEPALVSMLVLGLGGVGVARKTRKRRADFRCTAPKPSVTPGFANDVRAWEANLALSRSTAGGGGPGT